MWTNRGSQEPALVYNVIAAENLGAGNVVVIKDDGAGVKKAYLATSAVYVFGDPLGIVLSAAQTGVSARVVLEGRVENGAWSFGSADKFVYLSNSGAVTSSAMSTKLGYVLSSTAIYFKPSSAGGGQTDTVTGANGIQNTGNNVNSVIAPVYGAAANTIAEGNHNHDAAYSPIAKGVTNGDSHDHSGGDGAAISLTAGITGVLPIANGGTGSSDAGFDALRKMSHCAATGTDTITLSVLSGPNPTAYAIGQEFTFIEPAGGNASANPTVNVGGLGALTLTMGGASIPAGGLKSLSIYRVIVTSAAGLTGVIAPYDVLSSPGENYIINGGMAIDQINVGASTAIADDAYCFDMHYVLTETTTINVSQQTNQENGTPFNIRLTQNQATAQRMGLAHIIEAKDCKHLRGSAVTHSARVRLSTSANIRYAFLEWTGQEDAPVSELVNNWASATYTAGNFFANVTLTVTAVGSMALTANTLATISHTATLGSSANNVFLFIWTEGSAAQNVTLDISKWKFESGAVATPFKYRPYGQELALCERFCEKSYDQATIPGTATYGGAVTGIAGNTATTTGATFRVPKHHAPTMYLWSTGGTLNKLTALVSGLDEGSSLAIYYMTDKGYTHVSGAGGLTANGLYRWHHLALARL